MLKPGQDTHAVLPALTDALLTTGFLMQALGNSRPASSAEHVAAHIWELAGLVGNASLNLHGLLVALGSRCVLEVYREFYRGLPSLTVDIPARLSALAAEPSWEEHLDPAMSAFANQIRSELGSAERGPTAWQRRLTAFEREKERIRRLAEETLRDLEAGVAALRAVGLPFDPQAFGLGPKDAYLPFPNIRLLRNRYNTFWLMHELGLEDEPLKALRRLVGLS
jgi:glycerol-1-phosphate dehydrogenase [NAD(P)+]